jgi:hypothetical protein
MLRYVLRASFATLLMFAVGTLTAVAQYGGCREPAAAVSAE